MLKVVTGRFHPCLESALVEQIQRLNAADRWTKVAILAPSTPVLDRLRRVLVLDHRLALLNVHFLTFHQLALRLADEMRHRDGRGPLHVVDELFFQQLLRHLVEQRRDGSTVLRQLGESFGAWTALWATIRDLKEGGVDPATALQGVAEGCFGQEDEEWLRTLFSLQGAVEQIAGGLNVGTADDLAYTVVPFAQTSPFLLSMHHICYYGFYDLTQVQLSLFDAVRRTAPTTLFFPLESDPEYGFARRFFDRHLQPLLGQHPPLSLSAPEPAMQAQELSVRSVVGPEEELSAACRTILDLVETHGYRFDEIGVVARSLDPYCTLLQAVFDRHRIPMTTSARRPLIHHPLGKTLLLLASLPANDFYRTAVLDLVSSPFFMLPEAGGRTAAHRPEQWRAVVEALNITHGTDEWRRLERSCASGLDVDGNGDEIGALGPMKVAPHVSALLGRAVARLLNSFSTVPSRGTYGTLLEVFERLVEEHIRRPNDGREAAQLEPAPSAGPWEAVDQALLSLRDLTTVSRELDWTDFAELLMHAFERASVPLGPAAPGGVMIVDAMAARGLWFKAVFVLGLNEKVFPRYIREDPFLRDRHRLVLETTLGYKVDGKLPGYDEEALLFRLLRQAAGARLYLSFQRADDAGRALGPSPYIEGRQLPGQPVEIVPRRLTERLAQRPVWGRFTPPAQLAQWMAVHGQDAAALLRVTGGDAETFREGTAALARTESDQATLTGFDGVTGPLEHHWAALAERGIAPTPLERYARCPFRYFSADVLRLEPVRVPSSDIQDVRVLGTFCHGALRRCYEMLLPTGWPHTPVGARMLESCIARAIESAAAEVEQEHRSGHYLLWEMAKDSIRDIMAAVIDDGARAYRDDPFSPVAFEVTGESTIADIPGCGSTPLKIRGRVDRVDRHAGTQALRVIDYKLKIGKSITAEDRNLTQSAARGYRLQPPFYARLHLPDLGHVRHVQLVFLAPNGSTPVARSTFDSDVWSTDVGAVLRQTLDRLMNGIRDGRFFIVPDSYCKACEYRVACRREHMPTWWRASRAPAARELTALRSLKVGS